MTWRHVDLTHKCLFHIFVNKINLWEVCHMHSFILKIIVYRLDPIQSHIIQSPSCSAEAFHWSLWNVRDTELVIPNFGVPHNLPERHTVVLSEFTILRTGPLHFITFRGLSLLCPTLPKWVSQCRTTSHSRLHTRKVYNVSSIMLKIGKKRYSNHNWFSCI